MLDLILRGANLPDGRKGQDIAVANGRIAEVAPQIAAEARARSTPGAGWCRRPSSTAISTWMRRCRLGLPRLNSGTLLEGIRIWGELKPQLTAEAVKERALRYCDWPSRSGRWRSAAMSISATTGCSPSRPSSR